MFSHEEWEVVQTLSPLPELPPDPTNKYATDPAAAVFGQKMFFETGYSDKLTIGDDGQNGSLGSVGTSSVVSCAACHDPSTYFVDKRSKPGNVSLGVKFTTRNTPGLVNAVYYDYFGWGGKQDSLWMQAATSFESGSNSRGNRCHLVHLIWEKYKDEYNAIFDTPLPEALDPNAPDADRFPANCKPKSGDAPDGAWEKMTQEDRDAVLDILANQGKAVAAYESKLVSGNSDFDKYVAGDKDAISPAAKRGLDLFINKAACVDCHMGAFFSDNKFHNLGVPQIGPNLPTEDDGRYSDISKLRKHTFNSLSRFRDGEDPKKITDELMPKEENMGQFKTAILRGVALSGPYMHTGGFSSLREVVEFYNDGGGASNYAGVKSPAIVPLGLSDQEIDDLVAFLETLTGEPIPEELTKNPHEED